MKKTILFAALLATTLSASAFAADLPGDPCRDPRQLSQMNGQTMSCKEGKWTPIHGASVPLVKITMRLMRDGKEQFLMSMLTPSGQAVGFNMEASHPYLSRVVRRDDEVQYSTKMARSGFFVAVVPTLTDDEKAKITFSAHLTSIAFFDARAGADAIQLPESSSRTLNQTIYPEDGKEVVVPFTGSDEVSDDRLLLGITVTKEIEAVAQK